MNATDVIGWIVDGDYYCVNCTPTNEEDRTKDICAGGSAPIFCGSETDSFSHCEVCEELIPEVLTSEGWASVVLSLRGFLLERRGRPEILHQWAKHLDGSSTDPEEREMISLARLATDPDAVKRAALNEMTRLEGVKAALDKAAPCEKCEDPTCTAVRALKEMFHVR